MQGEQVTVQVAQNVPTRLKKFEHIFFLKWCRFFRSGVIKKSERRSRVYAFLSVFVKYANWKTIVEDK